MSGRRQRVAVGALGGGNRRHGLAPGMIEAMRERQGGDCAVCRTPLPPVPFVDHDHAMARSHPHPESVGCRFCVRGLLCNACNSLLGFARDDLTRLEAAAAYLLEWRRLRR